MTRSGTVGRATLAYAPHEGAIISDDLLRVQPHDSQLWGWLYAYLRASQTRAMMGAAQYGHIIKHLEVGHLNSLPVPVPCEASLTGFGKRAELLLEKRKLARELLQQAEDIFSNAIGPIPTCTDLEIGFSVQASDLLDGRRRLEASFHSPFASAILTQFADRGLRTEALAEVSERVWWMTRFKRVFGSDGVPYMSADELFSNNPPITKRVMTEQAENAEEYFVRAGWIVMACSGQVYGLNGSVALITERHEGAFLSHDLVRIIPLRSAVRPGYLYVTLGHPALGRPLVVRQAYGTSIPHLEPADVVTIPIVRLGEELEAEIANRAETAVRIRDEADELENSLAADAEAILERFMAGDTSDMSKTPVVPERQSTM